MKNILILIIGIFLAVGTMAQDRTVSFTIPDAGTYYNYTGVAADTLGYVDQDTIDIVVKYWGTEYVNKMSIKSRFDLISANDTTVSVSVYGKEFEDDATYVEIIAATLTDDINADNTVQVLTSDFAQSVGSYLATIPAYVVSIDTIVSSGTLDSLRYPAQTITAAAQTVTPFDKSYRYYRIRYILTGESALGTGVLIDDFEIKLYAN